jgi:tyrosyl-tRNA synthetase
MIKQGAVKLDGEKVENTKHQFAQPLQVVLQVGKRKFARINFK